MNRGNKLITGNCFFCVAMMIIGISNALAESQNWGTEVPPGGWPNNSLGPHSSSTLCNGSETFTGELQDPSAFAANVAGNNPFSGVINGGTFNGSGAVVVGMAGVPTDDGTTFVQDFTTPVENVTFSIFDLDSIQNAWRDRIIVTATNNNVSMPISLSCGAANDNGGSCVFSIAGNTATGPADQPTGLLAADGRVDISIPGPVDQISVQYLNIDPVGTSTQFIVFSDPIYQCGILGVAKTMTTNATGESPYVVNIDFSIENFGEVTMSNVSAPDDLTSVFGPTPANWSFNSISLLNGPAGFNINPAYNGSTVTELVAPNSTLPAPGGSQPSVANIRVTLDVVIYGTFTNQVTATGISPAGNNISDTSTNGADPDGVNNDGNPNEQTPSTFNTGSLPVTLSYFEAQSNNGELQIHWETDIEFDNIGFEIYADNGSGQRTQISRLQPSLNGQADFPQSYAVTLIDNGYNELWLADISNRGNKRWHGPFSVNQQAGEPSQNINLNWRFISDTLTPTTNTPASGVQVLDVKVNQDGLHRIEYQDLIAAGFDLSQDNIKNLALNNRGQATPIWVTPGPFGPGSYIDFIGEAVNNSLYTRENIYRLSFDSELARRIPNQTSRVSSINQNATHQASTRFAPNLIYDFSSPDLEPWRADQMLSFGQAVNRSYNLNLDRWVPSQQRFKSIVFGATDFLAQPATPPSENACGQPSINDPGGIPDHCIRLRLNNQPLAELSFDGLIPATLERNIPTAMLNAGNNLIEIEVPGEHGYPFDLVKLESLQIDYARELYAESANWAFQLSNNTLPRGDQLFTASFERPQLDSNQGLQPQAQTSGFAIDNIPGSDFVAYGFLTGSPVRLNGAERIGSQIVIPHVSSTNQYWVAASNQITKPQLSASQSEPLNLERNTEYLMIAHPAFIDTAEQLAQFHRNRGLTVSLVNVNQVYGHFNDGIVSPEAIRTLIAKTANTGQLRYILLIGGDSYDYFNYLNLDSVSHIPSIYGATDDIVKFAPLDPLYGDIDRDEIPDIPVGRLPVRNNQELSQIINKIINFVPADNGEVSAHFVADAAEPQYDYAQTSNELTNALPQSWSVTSTHRDEFDAAENAREHLLNAINQSPKLLTYLGHSGPRNWFRQPLFNADDALSLTNTDSNITIQWGCWNSYYVSPQADTLGHRLLLTGSQGAATVLGAASLSGVESETRFAALLMPALANSSLSLGEAVISAKRSLAQSNVDHRDVILGWTILGDPALKLSNP